LPLPLTGVYHSEGSAIHWHNLTVPRISMPASQVAMGSAENELLGAPPAWSP
jgi:hypothetical protein